MTVVEMTYIAAGVALPLFYIPQIARCLKDDAGLVSYSLRKSGMQLGLRVLMLPFIWDVGNTTMTWIVGLDLVGRVAELAAALTSLRAQGRSWAEICRRLQPIHPVGHQHAAPASPSASGGAATALTAKDIP